MHLSLASHQVSAAVIGIVIVFIMVWFRIVIINAFKEQINGIWICLLLQSTFFCLKCFLSCCPFQHHPNHHNPIVSGFLAAIIFSLSSCIHCISLHFPSHWHIILFFFSWFWFCNIFSHICLVTFLCHNNIASFSAATFTWEFTFLLHVCKWLLRLVLKWLRTIKTELYHLSFYSFHDSKMIQVLLLFLWLYSYQ